MILCGSATFVHEFVREVWTSKIDKQSVACTSISVGGKLEYWLFQLTHRQPHVATVE